MARKNVKNVPAIGNAVVKWEARGNVQVFYVKTAIQTFPPTRNGKGALAMAAHLLSRGIRSEIVTAYVPEFILGA